MRIKEVVIVALICIAIINSSCQNASEVMQKNVKVLYLHHSTGKGVLKGSTNKYWYKISQKGDVNKLIKEYNKKNNVNYSVTSRIFPKKEPYGWNNYPYDYYNIWVKNGDTENYLEEPNLDVLTRDYDVISLKHCFPASDILKDDSIADVSSRRKTLANYKLQYNALKEKMHQYRDTKFIVWTPPALVKNATTEEKALRANEFSKWIIKEWDEPNDNIFVWDFRKIETEGEPYLLDKYSSSSTNSHPNNILNSKAAKLFVDFLVSVINE